MSVVALIEDDPLVRVPLARGLEDAGYRVLAAASGDQGLACLEEHKIDVAVIDVFLPGRVDGVGLVREARRRNPGLKVLLTSGRPLPIDLTGIAQFLPKPFRLGDLIGKIRLAIASDDLVGDRDTLMRAQQVVEEFGKVAMFYATLRADEWRHHGDQEECRAWTQISRAVEQIQVAQRPPGFAPG
jgi:DNA-binding response OmpR family regulator